MQPWAPGWARFLCLERQASLILSGVNIGCFFSFSSTLFTAGFWGGRFAIFLYPFAQKEKIQVFDGSAYLMIRFYLRDWCGILQARNLNCNQDIIILRPQAGQIVLVVQSHSRLTRIVLQDVVFVTIACMIGGRAGWAWFDGS